MLPKHVGAYQTGWRRLIAGFIDVLVLQFTVVIEDQIASTLGRGLLSDAWWLFTVFSGVAYYVIGHAVFGQTIGKWVARVVVLDMKGNLPGWSRASLRDIIPILFAVYQMMSWRLTPEEEASYVPTATDVALVSVLMLWAVLEVFTMLFDRRRRALHDYIARTVVVRVDSQVQNSR